MNEPRIRADSFILKARRLRIHRVRHRGGGTILWLSPTAALRYLTSQQRRRLLAKAKGR